MGTKAPRLVPRITKPRASTRPIAIINELDISGVTRPISISDFCLVLRAALLAAPIFSCASVVWPKTRSNRGAFKY